MGHGQGDQPDQAVKRVDGQRQDEEGIAQGFQGEEEFSDHLVSMDYGLYWWLYGEAHPLLSQAPPQSFLQSFFLIEKINIT